MSTGFSEWILRPVCFKQWQNVDYADVAMLMSLAQKTTRTEVLNSGHLLKCKIVHY